MYYHEIWRQLEILGYQAINVKQVETYKGIAARWQVKYENEIIAHCFDAGDGSCLAVHWLNRMHLPVFIDVGENLCSLEPVETALQALTI